MKRRRRLSRKASKRSFRKGARVKRRNFASAPMRGGYRA